MKKENFIEKAKEIHKDTYDYSKVKYVNSITPVLIICPKHGAFYQAPSAHLSGRGCPTCAKEKMSKSQRMTFEDFVCKANKVHNGKYTYEKVNYVNNYTKICITCPIHGDFFQTPSAHLRGHGCPMCATKKKWYTEEFFQKAKGVHNGKYDYSNVTYINSHTPITITCPIHGNFKQTPNSHLHGIGCPKCGYEKVTNTNEDFIEKARNVHGDKYDYSKVDYVNGTTKVSIICPKHGEFCQVPNSHLHGIGCPKCGYERLRNLDKSED